MSDDFKIILPLLSGLLGALIGATAAIVAGVITQILQARYAARKKLDEIVAEKRVEACNQAYIRMKMVQSILGTRTSITERALIEALHYFSRDNEEWFLRSRLFLPGDFPDLWLAIRNEIINARNMERNSIGSAANLQQHLLNLVEKAIDEVYLVLGVHRIRPERYQRRKLSLRNRWRRWIARKSAL
jgi:hypothetical protein